jgi:hypothetical protein
MPVDGKHQGFIDASEDAFDMQICLSGETVLLKSSTYSFSLCIYVAVENPESTYPYTG